MSAQETTQPVRRGAAPGVIDTDLGELSRASESAAAARAGVQVEERRLRVASTHGGRPAAEQEQRLEDARRELEHAESFEQALENGDL